MTASATSATSVASASSGEFWGLLWRASGVIFVVLFATAFVIYGHQPSVGASAEALSAFYDGERTRILIAAVVSGNAVLFLLWFAAALRTTLADAGQGGWGAAAVISGAAFGGLSLLLTAIGAALAYSIAGSGNPALASGLNDFSWALLVLISFPRAMLIMSAAFGLWRARLISNGLFAIGVAFVVLGVMGTTTWVSGGPWAADSDFTRFVSPALLIVWVVVVSWVLFTRRPAIRTGW
jgi:hypothetical protein